MFCTSIITVYLGLQSISAYGLVGIAVTRYISIREPLLFNVRVTHCRALAATATLWVILLLTSAVLYFRLTPDGHQSLPLMIIIIFEIRCLQCFDTVGWAAGRASGP